MCVFFVVAALYIHCFSSEGRGVDLDPDPDSLKKDRIRIMVLIYEMSTQKISRAHEGKLAKQSVF